MDFCKPDGTVAQNGSQGDIGTDYQIGPSIDLMEGCGGAIAQPRADTIVTIHVSLRTKLLLKPHYLARITRFARGDRSVELVIYPSIILLWPDP